ncbi:glycosyl transferase, family 2 [Legionella busanensis]|uniref:Glycosyl transferase, family 2 n=1 Tax=Legionella busanensis TaxID=190655 RepID=A0A378JLE1_9GAMM|nr:glycosyltransferase family 2 protein [Legionella busanensis]STX52014.1 glycosyl transferase, family 2 [Legionella busanensis]
MLPFKFFSNNLPSVHILMPVFNTEPFITQALSSIAAQNYPDITLIIFDDASTDHSIQHIDSFLKHHPSWKVKVHIEHTSNNLGISTARQLLFDCSKTLNPQAYIFWLDSDDYYKSPNAISTVIHQMRSTDADICLFNFSVTFEDETQKSNATGLLADKAKTEEMLQAVQEIETKVVSASSFDVMQFTTLGWTKCYAPTITLPKTEKYPFEDFVYMSALLKANRITTLPPQIEIINYLRRSTSICGQRTPENFLVHIPAQLKCFMKNVFEGKNCDEDTIKKVEMAADFISRKMNQYRKTLENLIIAKTDPAFDFKLLKKFDSVTSKLYLDIENQIQEHLFQKIYPT